MEITDLAQFEEIIQSLENSYSKIKDIFVKENENKELINSTDTWTGRAQSAMYEKYTKLSSNFSPIEYSIKLYILFLKKTLDEYEKINEEIGKNLDILENELDVNS
jgi:hypothetical protein